MDEAKDHQEEVTLHPKSYTYTLNPKP